MASSLPACGRLERGQRISQDCTDEAKRALDKKDLSELDKWRAKAALECPVNGVIPLSNDEVSFECLYDMQKIGQLSPHPWWLRPFDPLFAGLNWVLKGVFRVLSPILTSNQKSG